MTTTDEPTGGPWTRHGHPIPGLTVHGTGRPPIYRCGGPSMCAQCKADAEAAMTTNHPARAFLDDLDAIQAKAMPLPWAANGSFLIGDILPAGDEEEGVGLEVAYVSEPADTTLIAAAVNAQPALVATVRAVLDLADQLDRASGARIRAVVTSALTPAT